MCNEGMQNHINKEKFMNGTHLAKRRNLMNKGRMFVCVLKGEV